MRLSKFYREIHRQAEAAGARMDQLQQILVWAKSPDGGPDRRKLESWVTALETDHKPDFFWSELMKIHDASQPAQNLTGKHKQPEDPAATTQYQHVEIHYLKEGEKHKKVIGNATPRQALSFVCFEEGIEPGQVVRIKCTNEVSADDLT
jgi:hypothetical protein